MKRKIRKRVQDVLEWILLVQFAFIFLIGTWITDMQVNLLHVFSFLILCWVYMIYLKRVSLSRLLSAFDAYIEDHSSSEGAGHFPEYKEWKSFTKRANRALLPSAIILVFFVVAGYLLRVSGQSYKDITLLLALLGFLIDGLIKARARKEYIENVLKFCSNLRPEVRLEKELRLNRIDISRSLAMGSLFAVPYAIAVLSVFDFSVFHYILHYIAFTTFFSASKVLFDVKKSISAISLAFFGFKLNDLRV